MRRDLGDGYELDDDRERIDLDAVYAFLSGESYWARGRSWEATLEVFASSQRLIGLYHGHSAQVGFCRVVSDGERFAYLADVYVLEAHRGLGLGVELVREAVINGPPVRRWMLHTVDAHPLYAKFGFGPPPPQAMEVSRSDLRDPLAEEPELPLLDQSSEG